jgi:hypothetical protein
MMEFESPRALRQWLLARQIPVQLWGRGTAKTVDALWHELRLGECALRADPVLRLTGVVVVWIQRGPLCLFELSQAWADGRIRPRNGPPSDKLRPAESWQEGALRCLWEELALSPSDITLEDEPLREILVERDSSSYPGLPSRYHSVHVRARVEGLPDGAFRTAEQDPEPSDPVRFHDWGWRPCHESDLPF